MAVPLLVTKLHMPSLPSGWVPRPQLVARLNEGLQKGCRCTLVSAPAGYGKTTLVSQWLSGVGCAWAWLSLDQSDSDPESFMAYLIAALDGAGTPVSEFVHSSLALPERVAPAALMVPLINDLSGSSEPLVVVLDDYHHIQSSEIHDAVALLTDRAPPTLHLVLVTRRDPPLPLSRWRARGEMQELRQDDLRFSQDEASRLYLDVLQVDLPSGAVSALHARTEGWVTGLQLAALSFQHAPDVSSAVAEFAGTDRFVLDYLVEDVLIREQPAVREFLLRTSILERFTADTCASLYQDAPADQEASAISRQLLRHSEERNLFLIPLDQRREWFRYHHLFSEALRMQLRQDRPGFVGELHRRASHWFEGAGLIDEAIHHAWLAGAVGDVVALLERVGMRLISRNEHRKLLSQLDLLPPENVASSVRLSLIRVRGLLSGQRWDEAARALDRIEARFGLDASPWVRGCIDALRAYRGVSVLEMEQAPEWVHSALANLSPDSDDDMTQMLIGTALFALGRYHYWVTADLAQADGYLDRAAAVAAACDDRLILGMALSALGSSAQAQGDLRRAEAVLRRALELARGGEGAPAMPLLSTDWLHHELASVLYHCNALDEAEWHQRHALELCELTDSFKRYYTYLGLGNVRRAQGHPEETLELLSRFRQLSSQGEASAMYVNSKLLWSDYAMRLAWPRYGLPLDQVADLVDALSAAPSNSLFDTLHRESGLAAGLMSLGRYEEAIIPLTASIQRSLQRGLCIPAMVSLSALAVTQAELGNWDASMAALGQRFDLDRHGVFVSDLLWPGPRMWHLLRRALQLGIHPAHVRHLLTTLPWRSAPDDELPPDGAPAAEQLLGPLTEREREVLRLWALRLSAQEIADQLTLSFHTVRSYLRTIYEKLGVHNRAEAITSAEEAGLI